MRDLKNTLNKIGITKIWFRFVGARSDRTSISTSQYIRYLSQTVYITPLLIGFASAYLFARVPQMQEIYLGVIEDGDYGRGLAGLAAVFLFSALLYAWNHTEVSDRIDAIYPDHADIYFDRRVFDVRDLKTAFASSLPFFGLLIGLGYVYRHVLDAAGMGLPLKTLPRLPHAVMVAGAITFSVYLALLLYFYFFRRNTKRQKQLLYFCYALTALLIAIPLVASNATLIASRLAGPLASTAFVLIEIAVAVRFLFWLAQKISLLLLALPSAILMFMDWLPLTVRRVTIVALPLLAVAVMIAGVIGGAGEKTKPQQDPPENGAGDLATRFRVWLDERKTSSHYPVFVVAAQGGGIYAASTAGAFLATMQDHCPAFARHVFAISAVSGGSVGASLFNAAFADSIARGTNRKASVDVEPGCDKHFGEQGELSKRLRKITQEDHISPVISYLLPDLIRPLLPDIARKPPCALASVSSAGRDQILEKSFLYSFKLSDPSRTGPDHTVCPEQGDKNYLIQPFSHGWSEKGDVPALILNATWVETGYRVAFSPFDLQPFGGGTLYSFGHLQNMPSDPPLIETAVISARFPGIMPPWNFKLDAGSHFTFVDGGYADSSGASTALQLYNQLKELGGDEVDLYLITLTDKFKALKTTGFEPAGSAPVRSWLYDVFSPFTTLLSVRDLQSRKAVKEAHTQLGEKMIVVQLDQKAFPLPLGWKLSGLSSDVIRLTIGDPERCVETEDRSDEAGSIANRNSCELRRIRDLLSPEARPSPTLVQQPVSPKIFGRWESSPQ